MQKKTDRFIFALSHKTDFIMSNQKTPYSKDEIAVTMGTVFSTINNTITELPEGILSQKPNQKWSIAEQFTHLIQSCYPVASALKLPKEQLANFGTPNKASRTFEELKEVYYTALAGGLKAGGAFVPKVDEGTTKASMLESWKGIGAKFQTRISEWNDNDLDNYFIPHPAIGNLTVREMLFFTIFHNTHHLKAIEALEEAFV